MRWRRGLSCIQMIPVEDRIERQEIGPLSLPSPERTESEHHYVPLSKRQIHCRGPVRQSLAAGQRPREKQITGIRRELYDDARPVFQAASGIGGAASTRTRRASRSTSAAPATAPSAGCRSSG